MFWSDLILPPINLYSLPNYNYLKGQNNMEVNNPFLQTSNPQYSEFIYKSRYARWNESKKRRENWDETVTRYIDFFKNRTNCEDIDWDKLYYNIYNLKVMPSMRALMTAGKALERDNVASYNCAFLNIDDLKAFDEMLYILACGTGVGFSVERQFIKNLPTVSESFVDSNTIIEVPDSKIGWATSFRELIALLYSGKIPKWDMRKVRKAGEKLKTFGGRASGPEPLNDLFKFTVNLIKNAAGRKLNSIECHDLCCKVAEIIVVGGVRRSALISLSNLSDDRMRVAKSGAWWENNVQRALANNSVCYTEKPEMDVFIKEWLSLYESKSGERGIYNRVAAYNLSPERRKSLGYTEFGCNPCLHPDSLVETIHGRVKIKDITEPTMVYSMDKEGKLVIKPCSASWVSKRNAETLTITIASGKQVRCTPNHKIFIVNKGWVEAKDIKIGDKVSHLVRSRKGSSYSGVKLSTDINDGRKNYKMEHRLVFESYYGVIPEGYDVHHIDGDTYNNDIDNLECLSHKDHATLTALEQPNNHMVTGVNPKVKSGYGFISPPNSKHGAKVIIPMPDELKSNLHQYATVVCIEQGETTDVYDLTVEDTHNFVADFVVVHNCSEITLRSDQFCNLTEVVIRADDTEESLLEKIEIATILGTLQSTVTDFRYLRKIWKANCEEERLLGVSLTGIMDNPITNGSNMELLKALLPKLKQRAIDVNIRYANILGISPATAITCVKPSGTVSQLVDSASGIHPRYAKTYIRTVRGDKKDPLSQFIKDSGIYTEDDVTKTDSTFVFSFPIKAPESSVFRDDRTAIEQLELWKTYQLYYCEHKPSITVYVKEHEWLEIAAWVYKNFDILSGVSFLPHSDHSYRQAPYQEINEDEYNKFVSDYDIELDWINLQKIELEDNTTNTKELACSAGVCEL